MKKQLFATVQSSSLSVSECANTRGGWGRLFKSFVPGLVMAAAVKALPAAQVQAASKGNKMVTKPSASIQHYGNLDDQTPVVMATLKNSHGIEMDVISYGGIITRLVTPDSKGKPGNIVLGLDDLQSYVTENPYFGAIIGRYGNRIGKARFTLDGVEYQLGQNDGDNHLHGGFQGFDKRVWNMTPFVNQNAAGVRMTLTSPNGDQGYPGELKATVVYSLTNDNQLDMQFYATTDQPTVVNMTQHSYFNLAGKGDILDHQLTLNADAITPVDKGLIPTGKLVSVEGTPFDFRQPKAIGRDIKANDQQMTFGLGYDHNFILNTQADENGLMEAAVLSEPKSGRVLKVLTDQPAVQFYSGNFLDGSLKQQGRTHKYRTGLCLEPQHYPDTPNKAEFPSTTLLPGDTYKARIVYVFE